MSDNEVKKQELVPPGEKAATQTGKKAATQTGKILLGKFLSTEKISIFAVDAIKKLLREKVGKVGTKKEYKEVLTNFLNKQTGKKNKKIKTKAQVPKKN